MIFTFHLNTEEGLSFMTAYHIALKKCCFLCDQKFILLMGRKYQTITRRLQSMSYTPLQSPNKFKKGVTNTSNNRKAIYQTSARLYNVVRNLFELKRNKLAGET
eukprot:TRINITY_DN16603_c0_g1_i1.p2 TRINITY_DN16603_c0_g1~~TRINITY_DN16603_c0_g1_i1.p2  ORF type:complete len:104 (-),score=10.23 TRINITY_DN16603_c0_g1_i1:113-424(-)